MPETLAQAPQLQSLVDKDTTLDLTWYFQQCEENRALLQDVYVVIPVRPSDGMNCTLHRMVSVWYGEGTAYSDLQDVMGGFIEHTRANMALSFLKNPPIKPNGEPCKYLLMIDNDMEPPVNLPWMLARHDLPVVSGCAMSIDKEWGPQLCFSMPDSEGNYRFPCLRAGQPIPSQGVVRVGHAGTGAMLIRRDVLEAFSWEGEDIPFMVPEAERRLGMQTGLIKTGEDIAFCNQLRAKGIPVHVDLEAHVGHRKTLTLQWDDDMRDPMLSAAHWKIPDAGKIIVST